jgi:putative DNA methylase
MRDSGYTMSTTVISPKKLIEVALPLDAINVASAREKSIRHGHPSTLHLWWARRPLAAARAVIFSQLVNDPEDLWKCQNPGKEPNQQVKGHWTKARAKLFTIIEKLVKWENTTNETVLKPARETIRQSWRDTCELNKHHPDAMTLFDPEKMPGLHDPFAGGGAIPLEAQRLGLEAFASDLNPVAVLINKAMIEIPPKFAGKPPVFPGANTALTSWSGAAGLAEDVRRYGQWMRDEAFKRIGHHYPPIEITKAIVKERPDLKQYEGEKLTVIAWLWARTVKSPNPAFSDVDVPLASTFILSSKEGKEAYVQPVIKNGTYAFTVKVGNAPASAKAGTTAGKRAAFICLMSKVPMGYEYIREQGKTVGLGQKLMAIVAEGERGRVYISPTAEHEDLAATANPEWIPDNKLPDNPRDFKTPNYGLMTFGSLFTPRQLVALNTFSNLVGEARDRILKDALASGLPDDGIGLDSSGGGAKAYAEAVSVYLGMAISYACNYWSGQATPAEGFIRGTFAKQALPMTWDFAEAPPFGATSGNWLAAIDWSIKAILLLPATADGFATQVAAQTQTISLNKFVSTDPPYYDNIGYADLSDYFYIWLRRSLRHVYPDLLSTIAVPKADELVATPYRHGTKQKAEKFFLEGMSQAMHNLAVQAHPSAPITIYYAFKQAETESDGTNSTGWETFLDAVLKSGLAIYGTWPMRTERAERSISIGSNALASSIILVCRPRLKTAGTIDRRKFIRLLNEALPLALDAMTRESEGLHSPVAPVDLSQAIIGPGMAIFSRYDAVLEADGTPMTVKTALQLINRFLAEDDFDADTQFCLRWFEQHGWEDGQFGEADVLARAKGTSVQGVKEAGVVESGGGSVRLYSPVELDADWDIDADPRIPVWQVLHELIAAQRVGGDTLAARIYAHPKTAGKTEAARQLAYRLYTLCERANRAEDARRYNELVTGWSGIESTAAKIPITAKNVTPAIPGMENAQ